MDHYASVTFFISVFILQAIHVTARDICRVSGSYYTYCEDGFYCCDHNTWCCTVSFSLSKWAIIGIVLAVLLGLCLWLLFTIVITKKKKLRPGQLIHPRDGYRIPVTSSTTPISGNMYQDSYATNSDFLFQRSNVVPSCPPLSTTAVQSQEGPECLQISPNNRPPSTTTPDVQRNISTNSTDFSER